MLDRLMDFLRSDANEARPTKPELDVSVAVLLVEAAHMDDTFDESERVAILELLSSRFDLNAAEAEDLVETARERVKSSSEYFRFTHEITHNMTETERAGVIEMLWRVAYADGTLDPHEDALIRQISGLIGVSDRVRALARQRALAAMGA